MFTNNIATGGGIRTYSGFAKREVITQTAGGISSGAVK
jgi:hypothetical protein